MGSYLGLSLTLSEHPVPYLPLTVAIVSLQTDIAKRSAHGVARPSVIVSRCMCMSLKPFLPVSSRHCCRKNPLTITSLGRLWNDPWHGQH